METIDIYWACLFDREPAIGDINPVGEIYYKGYARVQMAALNGKNLTEIRFPASEQGREVFASHVVAVDNAGKVVGVRAL
jgi:hypothetical protein